MYLVNHKSTCLVVSEFIHLTLYPDSFCMGDENEWVWGGRKRGREGGKEGGKERGRKGGYTYTFSGHVLNDLHLPGRPCLLESVNCQPCHGIMNLTMYKIRALVVQSVFAQCVADIQTLSTNTGGSEEHLSLKPQQEARHHPSLHTLTHSKCWTAKWALISCFSRVWFAV